MDIISSIDLTTDMVYYNFPWLIAAAALAVGSGIANFVSAQKQKKVAEDMKDQAEAKQRKYENKVEWTLRERQRAYNEVADLIRTGVRGRGNSLFGGPTTKITPPPRSGASSPEKSTLT